ncbi:MAG TPA: lysophospholipid acyltransferase family protein [Thermoanaerobaculia bacterium]|nr:lysophospholipid acyltransferase family protein [Thermoanaerobaculia bacterium]
MNQRRSHGRRGKGVLRTRAEYLLYRSMLTVIRAAGPERTGHWGERLGVFASGLLRGRTRMAVDNVMKSFPGKSRAECREIVRECWRYFGRAAFEYLRFQYATRDEIESRCEILGFDHFETALARDRGVILLSAHYGSWELGAMLLASLGAPVTTVARPLDNALLDRDLRRSRTRSGLELVDRRKAARALIRALDEKHVIVLLPDQAARPSEGILVPFLGRPAWTTAAPARLALRFGAPIVFVFCTPTGERSRIEFQEPIFVDELPESDRAPEAITQRINDVISAQIREAPQYWLWMHNRWKRAATGRNG